MFKKVTSRHLLIFLFLASVSALLGAYVSQYFFNLQPCELCLWQRKPFFVVIAISAIFLFIPFLRKYQNFAVKMGIMLLLVNAAIAFYHAGVEKKYFKGLSSCSGSAQIPTNLNELIISLAKAPIVSCGDPQFIFLNISMAGWNFIYCALLAIFIYLFSRKSSKNKLGKKSVRKTKRGSKR
ncbi:MAG: disulfide bond formation protein DsbB [Rickettsiales bacterium]|jgi:disulfide bond formation protein DsbB